jgi:hypothetical protein
MPKKKNKNNSSRVKTDALASLRVGFPVNRMVKMRYSGYAALSGTSGVLNKHTWSCNNIFDPDVTGTGGQPLGHDEWSSFYTNYVVHQSTIKVTMLPGAAQTIPVIVGVRTEAADTSWSDYDRLVENDQNSYTVLNPSTAVPAFVRRQSYDAKRFFNLVDVKDNETRLGAAFGAGPSDQAYFCVWGQALDKGTTWAAHVHVEITYLVEVSQPITLNSS